MDKGQLINIKRRREKMNPESSTNPVSSILKSKPAGEVRAGILFTAGVGIAYLVWEVAKRVHHAASDAIENRHKKEKKETTTKAKG